MNFCMLCGSTLNIRIPVGDDRERHVCTTCGHVHYQNPRIIVCALPCFEDKVLLCKRAIEPRFGLWTLPGGFMENGESTLDAARRETFEEARARIELHGLYALYNLTHIDQVHLFFRASLSNLDFSPGLESLEVRLFTEAEIPWQEIAFPAVASTLQQYFRDLPSRLFPLRLADVVVGANNSRTIKIHDTGTS